MGALAFKGNITIDLYKWSALKFHCDSSLEYRQVQFIEIAKWKYYKKKYQNWNVFKTLHI